MALPSAYQRGGGDAISSYSYTDIADNTGVTIYNGCMTGNSGATSYFLTTQSPHSGNITTPGVSQSTVTLNFDTSSFNLPRTVKGTAFATIPIGGAQNIVNLVRAKVQKYDGTTATDLSDTYSGASHTWGASAASKGAVTFLTMPLTQTIIKKGENIRLVVSFVTDNIGASEIGHDPQDRDGTYILPSTVNTHTTKLVFYCPFRLDL